MSNYLYNLNRYSISLSFEDDGTCWPTAKIDANGEYVGYDQAATMLAAKDAELILMKSDRDGWRWMIGEIASSVPLNLSLKVNGSIRDLIYYLKGLAKRAEEAEYRVAELECEIEAIGSHDDKALK